MLSKEQNTRNIIETGRVQESDYRAALVCRCGAGDWRDDLEPQVPGMKFEPSVMEVP